MATKLRYGQHPVFAIPWLSFPIYARVGFVVAAGSGVKRLIKAEYVREAEDETFKQIVFEDRELAEILEIILLSGALD